jgi:hypothetical protein
MANPVALQAGRGREVGSLPFPHLRKADGRLFAERAADVPAVLAADIPLEIPMELGSLTFPLVFLKAGAI